MQSAGFSIEIFRLPSWMEDPTFGWWCRDGMIANIEKAVDQLKLLVINSVQSRWLQSSANGETCDQSRWSASQSEIRSTLSRFPNTLKGSSLMRSQVVVGPPGCGAERLCERNSERLWLTPRYLCQGRNICEG